MDAEYSNGHRNSQFKIIACCRERKGGGLLVICSRSLAHVERNHKHDHEVQYQGNGNTDHIQRQFYDVLAFQ